MTWNQIAIAAVFLLVSAVPTFASLPADTRVLVLVDGSRLAIQGDVEIDGRRLTFTDAQGRLAMLRTSDVDIDATVLANQPTPTDAESGKESNAKQSTADVTPILVLTNADVRTVSEADVQAPQFGRKVIIYSASWCPTCRKAKKVLDQWRVSYDERDVDTDPLAREEKDEKDPDCGIPVIDVGGQLMCGLQTKRLAEMLREAGIEPVIGK